MVESFKAIDTVLLKTASRCNLNCTYCYVYNMGDDGWRSQPKKMSTDALDAIVRQLGRLAELQERPFSVCLHGGEPLMLGLESTTRLVSGLRSVLPPSCDIHVQTNGTLLSQKFIDLFSAYDVGVSISFDGPVSVNDKSRLDHKGRGSHARITEAIDRLRADQRGSDLFTGVLAVVDPTSDPTLVYEALKSTGAPSFDLLYRDGNHQTLPPGKASFESVEYGTWMLGLIEVYLSDPTPPQIRVVDDLVRLILGGEGRKEGVGVTDYGILVIDTDGTITKNDTLKVAGALEDRFEQKWSIFDADIAEVLCAEEMVTYHQLQKPTAKACIECPLLTVCGGGMPAHRWSEGTGYDNPTVFCADQKIVIGRLRDYLLTAQAA